ncbi:MAG: T9SS type A sorting domain-containing protein [Chitinophagales bacterium]|nr:T9SS type A sorting domain-containing protein [Chitinophagales bacterium]HRX23798.1 T9SS type A sorting domain-containing protein [Chitinophagales bacterium]
MRKTLLAAAISIGLIGATTAEAANLCFSDSYGFTYQVTATKTGPMYWEMTGVADVLSGYLWDVEGYWDRFNQSFYMNVINPEGCATYVDNFEFFSTFWTPGYLEMSWNNYCDGYLGSGTNTMTYSSGSCGLRTSGETFQVGPNAVGASPFGLVELNITETRSLTELLEEQEVTVNRMGEGFVFFGDVFTHDGTELIIYNHAGQQIAVLNGNGSNSIVWDGIATAGNVAVNGMYVAVIRSEEEKLTVKFVK